MSANIVVSRQNIPVVGLIGGIGSGKSSVAHSLKKLSSEKSSTKENSTQETFNVVVLDGDQAGHQALLMPAVKSQIVERFGKGILNESGEIERRTLAMCVFGPDPTHRQALSDLEAITHPEIRQSFEKTIADIRQGSQDVDALLLDAAVLLESAWQDICDAVIFVDTPLELRLQRVAARGWDADELQKREASQMSLAKKRAASDYIIDNSGTLDDSARQLHQILKTILTKS